MSSMSYGPIEANATSSLLYDEVGLFALQARLFAEADSLDTPLVPLVRRLRQGKGQDSLRPACQI